MFTEQQIKQIRKSLGEWLLYKVITDNRGLIPDVDNFLAFLEKGASIKEEQKKIVDKVIVQHEVSVRDVKSWVGSKGDNSPTIEDPMEGMVCDSCQ